MTFLICQSRFLIFDAGCVPFRSSPKYGRHIFSFQVLPRLPAFRAYFVNDYGLIIALFDNFTKPIIRPRSKWWRIISHINSQRLLCKIVGRRCFDISRPDKVIHCHTRGTTPHGHRIIFSYISVGYVSILSYRLRFVNTLFANFGCVFHSFGVNIFISLAQIT